MVIIFDYTSLFETLDIKLKTNVIKISIKALFHVTLRIYYVLVCLTPFFKENLTSSQINWIKMYFLLGNKKQKLFIFNKFLIRTL